MDMNTSLKKDIVPNIHVYGANHSPWVQAVLLTLHMKNLKYSLSSLLDPLTFIESVKQGVPSPVRMPALWYNGKCYYESANIIAFLDETHPQTPQLFKNENEEEVGRCLQKVFALFPYALTRIAGQKKIQFWYEWSICKDHGISKAHQILTRFFRPFMVLYFWCLIHLVRYAKFKGTWPIETFRKAIAHFSDKISRNGGQYVNGLDVTYADILVFGHFQTMFSGSNGMGALSGEVIPIIDEYPIMWTWLNRMHQHPLLIDYPFMYSKGDKNVAQRIGTMESDDLVETDSIFGQIIYWVGFWALFAFAPLTLLALLAMICTRIWKTRGNYKEPPFKFICEENKTKSD